jgi:hypothetical protein
MESEDHGQNRYTAPGSAPELNASVDLIDRPRRRVRNPAGRRVQPNNDRILKLVVKAFAVFATDRSVYVWARGIGGDLCAARSLLRMLVGMVPGSKPKQREPIRGMGSLTFDELWKLTAPGKPYGIALPSRRGTNLRSNGDTATE